MWQCTKCGLERENKTGSNRTPINWKRQGELLFCGGCWRSEWVLRAIAMPVTSPVDCAWDDIEAATKAMWKLTTQASNWMMTEFYARDVRRTSIPKMPPMPKIYLYPEARKRFPGLPSQSIAAIENAIQKKYRSTRYNIIWTCAQSLPSFRYPTPFPIPGQGWTAELRDDAPIVSARIGDSRISVRLKTGSQFRRQLMAFREIAAGKAMQGELALYRKRVLTDGKPHIVIMVKMVAWFPRPTKGEMTGVLFVRTGPNDLVIALNEKGDTLWTYHADQVVRWKAEHSDQLQRWADDSKMEHRHVPSFTDRRTTAVTKYRERMDTLCQQVSIMIAGYAHRRKFLTVRYDDTDRSFCPEFVWYKLRQLTEQKVDQFGITFEHVGKTVDEPVGPEPESPKVL